MEVNIDSFIKKYRAAVAAKSKDIRISLEEATDIITSFATIQTIKENETGHTHEALRTIMKEIRDLKDSAGPNSTTSINGGSFK